MKITIQNEGLTVSIDNHEMGSTATEARDLCASAMLALTYHPDTVASVFPSEEDIDDAIREGVKYAILEGVKEPLEYKEDII
jgi:hypothetical protein